MKNWKLPKCGESSSPWTKSATTWNLNQDPDVQQHIPTIFICGFALKRSTPALPMNPVYGVGSRTKKSK
jgi:uncharacterized alpha/beta hydrolase family protein